MVKASILGLSQLQDLSPRSGAQSMLWLPASVAVGQCPRSLPPVLCQQPPYMSDAQPDHLLGLGGCHFPAVDLGQHYCPLVLFLAPCHHLQIHTAMVTFSLDT